VLIGTAIGAIAWYAVSALAPLLTAWPAGRCGVEVLFSGWCQ
jgi:hypothetical protein